MLVGRRSFHHEVYPKFYEYRYQNKLLFTMENYFECITLGKKTRSYCLWVIVKRDYPDISEDKYENYCGEDLVACLIGRSHFSKLFK